MRALILTPRWIMWHVLTLGAMAACGFLAAWQWGKAGSAMGSAINVGYGLQWPVFAVFFGYMWWRMLSLEAARTAPNGARAEPSAVPEPEPLPFEPLPPVTAPVLGGPSPFGPRPHTARALDDDEDPDDRALSSYNRMLAQLAAHDSED